MRRILAISLLALACATTASAQTTLGNFSRIKFSGCDLLAGSGAPDSSDGTASCGIYIDTSTSTIYTKNGSSWTAVAGGGGSGTVTSVGLSMPGMFSVSGSPVTASGTMTVTLTTQSANTVLAGPTSGSAAQPSYRQIVFGDIASNSCASGQIMKYNGSAWACADDAGASSGAPTAAQYLALATDATLTNERILTAGDIITLTDGGAGGNLTVKVTPTSDDQVYVGNGTVMQAKTLPDCDNGTTDKLLYDQSTNAFSCGTDQSGGGGGGSIVWMAPQGMRLSAATNTYASASDVTGATSIYWTPVLSGGSGSIVCYDGSGLDQQTISQKSLALGTLTSATNYNVYYDCDGATLALGAAWTDATTPSETLADESGAIVLSTDHTKLYLGVIRTTSTTTIEDSAAKRFVWNAYNRKSRALKNPTETTNTWNYATASYRQANGNTANQFEYVVGFAEDAIEATVRGFFDTVSAGANANVGIGIDSTSTNGATIFGDTGIGGSSIVNAPMAYYRGIPGVGHHTIVWLELGASGGRWYGDANNPNNFQAGIIGTILN